MREQAVRGAFSFLAALVFGATAAEWMLWGIERDEPWRFAVSAFLTAMALFETAQVWKRADRLLGVVVS